MRYKIQWQLQNQKIPLLRSVSVSGLCPVNVSRKLKRYRNMFKLASRKIIPRRLPGPDITINTCRCQRTSRLSDISGLRILSHRHSEKTLSKRKTGSGTGSIIVCPRFNNHRSMPLSISMGNLSKDQGGNKAPYTAGFTWLDPHVHQPYTRKCPRCYHTGHSAYKTKINRHNGSRVYRLQSIICDSSTSRFFRHSCKEQSEVSPSDFTKGGQSFRASGRSNNLILKVTKSKEAYPETLRRVSYVDPETNKRFVFLTNIFTIPAEIVAGIYKQRWQIELFFKWIKQHLRIKSFFGTSFNAVKTQVWVAISIYLLVAIMKKRLNLPGSLHTTLQILEVNIFEKKPIIQLVSDALKQGNEPIVSNQLNLFDP